MGKKKARNGIDSLGQKGQKAYMEGLEKMRAHGREHPQCVPYEGAMNCPETFWDKEVAINRKRRKLQAALGEKRCGDCRRWIKMNKNRVYCPHCVFLNIL